MNDFRKLCEIECYSPSDNVSELTARTNDDGWETIYSEWLKVSNLCEKDALFVLSVGGGKAFAVRASALKNLSTVTPPSHISGSSSVMGRSLVSKKNISTVLS